MIQEIKQTDEEKMTMYMKLSKKEIIKMLIQSNKLLDSLTHKHQIYELQPKIPYQSDGTAIKCLRDGLSTEENMHLYCPCPKCNPTISGC